MKLSIKQKLLTLLAVPVLAAGFVAVPAFADTSNLSLAGGAGSAQGTDQSPCLFGNEGTACDGKTPVFKTITNVLLFIIGAVSVIMLVIGGIRYTISAGDSSAVTGAKNTILYAIVGIVVALLAYAVVNFVIGAFVPKA
jgi:hypothetical protein